ncbi:hypothetical protein JCM19235_1314 [Vibrio maritimus]|uniref:Uncharacterized protein n=1 Tax=Vibrio maritimus TaxID=990268 RepID=A0A090S8B6_9VIBR|nr:hypothetical protein JCM19235_1314 [Vibrio maritimus]
MKIQESQRLIANQLIGYANLPVVKKPFMEDGEFRFMMTRRPGCPLSEKRLKQEMSDTIRSVIRYEESVELKQRVRQSLSDASINSLRDLLQLLIS